MKAKLMMVAMVAAQAAMADYYGPLLTKTLSAGFTLPEYRISKRCEIYPDKIEIHRYVGGEGLGSKEVRRVGIADSAALDKTIDGAAKGPIKEIVGPTDAPVTTYKAVQLSALGVPSDVVLSQDGFGGKENESREARTLKNFIDLHCD